jgi:hypothetical protein
VYEVCVDHQPTVEADLSCPPPIDRPVQAVSQHAREVDQSAVGATIVVLTNLNTDPDSTELANQLALLILKKLFA